MTDELERVAKDVGSAVEDAVSDLDTGECDINLTARSFHDQAFVTVTLSKED